MKRRAFIKNVAVTTSICAISPFNILEAGASPNSKLNIAVIGFGGQGASNAAVLARTDNVVALCDIHESWHKQAIKRYKELHNINIMDF